MCLLNWVYNIKRKKIKVGKNCLTLFVILTSHISKEINLSIINIQFIRYGTITQNTVHPHPHTPPPTQSGISKTGNMILKKHTYTLFIPVYNKNIYLPVIATESISNMKILTDMVDFNGQVSLSFMHNKFPRIV